MKDKPYKVVKVEDFVAIVVALRETQDALTATIERLVELEEAVHGKTELR